MHLDPPSVESSDDKAQNAGFPTVAWEYLVVFWVVSTGVYAACISKQQFTFPTSISEYLVVFWVVSTGAYAAGTLKQQFIFT